MGDLDNCVKDDSTLARESDLNFAVDDDEENFERRGDFDQDQNQHEQRSSPSLNPEYSYLVATESGHDSVVETKFAHDPERTQSPFKDNNQYQGEMDELHGSNFLNPSSHSKSQTFHNETGAEDSAHSQESPLTANANRGAGEQSESDMGRPIDAPHGGGENRFYSERSQYEYGEPKKDDSLGENRNPGIYHSDLHSPKRTAGGSVSPKTKRQMSISPEGSPSHQGSQAQMSHCQKISSPELHKGISLDQLSPTRQSSASTQGIQRQSQRKDSSSHKHITSPPRSHRSPPRSHRSPPKYRRRDRSESRSPIRHRDSYGSQRDYRDRTRSRSPYSRVHHRSTRERHSPRRRSPFPEYHSPHRSPRRRPWSPPPNRKTGLGKPGRNLFVAGFSFATTERDLERKFSRYGRVQHVRIVRDKRSGDSRGFGFLTLETDEDADAAIRALDETEWNGRIILVEKSKS
ncbi:hypothetical protein FF1_030517 [Malus domestica]